MCIIVLGEVFICFVSGIFSVAADELTMPDEYETS